MKAVARISLIFCVMVTITKGWILPFSVSHLTFFPKKLVSVSRVTRQVDEAWMFQSARESGMPVFFYSGVH